MVEQGLKKMGINGMRLEVRYLEFEVANNDSRLSGSIIWQVWGHHGNGANGERCPGHGFCLGNTVVYQVRGFGKGPETPYEEPKV